PFADDPAQHQELAIVRGRIGMDRLEPCGGLCERGTLDKKAKVEPAIAPRRTEIMLGDVEAPGDRNLPVEEEELLMIANEVARAPAARKEGHRAALGAQRREEAVGRIGRAEAVDDRAHPNAASRGSNEPCDDVASDRIVVENIHD